MAEYTSLSQNESSLYDDDDRKNIVVDGSSDIEMGDMKVSVLPSSSTNAPLSSRIDPPSYSASVTTSSSSSSSSSTPASSSSQHGEMRTIKLTSPSHGSHTATTHISRSLQSIIAEYYPITTSMPANRVRALYMGRLLKHQDTVSSAGILDGHTIHVIIPDAAALAVPPSASSSAPAANGGFASSGMGFNLGTGAVVSVNSSNNNNSNNNSGNSSNGNNSNSDNSSDAGNAAGFALASDAPLQEFPLHLLNGFLFGAVFGAFSFIWFWNIHTPRATRIGILCGVLFRLYFFSMDPSKKKNAQSTRFPFAHNNSTTSNSTNSNNPDNSTLVPPILPTPSPTTNASIPIPPQDPSSGLNSTAPSIIPPSSPSSSLIITPNSTTIPSPSPSSSPSPPSALPSILTNGSIQALAQVAVGSLDSIVRAVNATIDVTAAAAAIAVGSTASVPASVPSLS